MEVCGCFSVCHACRNGTVVRIHRKRSAHAVYLLSCGHQSTCFSPSCGYTRMILGLSATKQRLPQAMRTRFVALTPDLHCMLSADAPPNPPPPPPPPPTVVPAGATTKCAKTLAGVAGSSSVEASYVVTGPTSSPTAQSLASARLTSSSHDSVGALIGARMLTAFSVQHTAGSRCVVSITLSMVFCCGSLCARRDADRYCSGRWCLSIS